MVVSLKREPNIESNTKQTDGTKTAGPPAAVDTQLAQELRRIESQYLSTKLTDTQELRPSKLLLIVSTSRYCNISPMGVLFSLVCAHYRIC